MKYTTLLLLAIWFVGCDNEKRKEHVMYEDETLKITKYFGDYNKRTYWLHIAPNGMVYADTTKYNP